MPQLFPEEYAQLCQLSGGEENLKKMMAAYSGMSDEEKAASYAISVTGISDGQLSKLRRLAGGCTKTRVQGRSLEVDIALVGVKRLDPAYEAHRQPVFAWAAAVWEKSVSIGLLQTAIDGTRRLKNCKFPWAAVSGPAAGLFLTLKRLSWKACSAAVLEDDAGRRWNLEETCPRTIVALVDLAIERWVWKSAEARDPAMRRFSSAGPFLEPIASLLRQRF